jgi:hypothetical protein
LLADTELALSVYQRLGQDWLTSNDWLHSGNPYKFGSERRVAKALARDFASLSLSPTTLSLVRAFQTPDCGANRRGGPDYSLA